MKIEADLVIGDRTLPVSHGFRVMWCGDPNCGPHIILIDRNDRPFLEFLMSHQQVTDLMIKTLDHRLEGLENGKQI